MATVVPPLDDGRAIAIIPVKPIASPAIWSLPGRWRNNTEATMAVKMGTVPLSIPATDEATHCWAMGNMVRGIAIQIRLRNLTRGRSAMRIGTFRDAGSAHKNSVPNPTRIQVTNPGWKASRPMAMKRNEAPQIALTDRNSVQSVVENALRFVPCVVVRSRLAVISV